MKARVRDTERSEKAQNYFNSKFKVKDYLVKVGMMDNRSSQDKVSCLLKNERTPSMWITDWNKTLKFTCFSCGAKGDYISFLVHYKTSRGITTNYYKELEDLLREDDIARASLGFNSLYKSVSRDIIYKRREIRKVSMDSWVILADDLANFSVTDKMYAIHLVEQGKGIEDIRAIMLHQTYKSKEDVTEEENDNVGTINVFADMFS